MQKYLIENKKKKSLEHHRQMAQGFIDKTSPLESLGLKAWSYVKCTHDGQYLAYSTSPQFTEEHIMHVRSSSNHFKNMMIQDTKPIKKFYLQGDIKNYDTKNDPVLELLYNNTLWNGFGIYNMERPHGMDGWMFCLEKSVTHIEPFFQTIEPYLERFITYFETIAPEYVDLSNTKTLSLYDEDFSFFGRPQEEKDNNNLIDFLQKTQIHHLNINGQEGPLHLTARQGQCLYYLMQHYSVKEIAKILELSPRTVETYIHTIKDKIGASSRSDLIKFINAYALQNKLALFV